MNLAILSFKDPETARGLASPPPPGEEERELEVGGVKWDLRLAWYEQGSGEHTSWMSLRMLVGRIEWMSSRSREIEFGR